MFEIRPRLLAHTVYTVSVQDERRDVMAGVMRPKMRFARTGALIDRVARANDNYIRYFAHGTSRNAGNSKLNTNDGTRATGVSRFFDNGSAALADRTTKR